MLREISFGAKILKLLPAALFASLTAFPALARQDPNPPPSGIVVHLFGPDSVTSHILPAGSEKPPAGQAAPQGGDAPVQAAPEPTVDDILHQMFVTGDPAQDSTPHFAPGRKAD